MEDKKEKIQILADKLISLLPLFDSFMESLSEEDFELLDECKEALIEKINRNNGAMALIYACGGSYDDTEDCMKVKTLEGIIELLKVRKKYREEKIKMMETKQKQQEVLNLFGLMGM